MQITECNFDYFFTSWSEMNLSFRFYGANSGSEIRLYEHLSRKQKSLRLNLFRCLEFYQGKSLINESIVKIFAYKFWL